MTTTDCAKELSTLAQAFLTCKTQVEYENFLRDLLTAAEIKEFAGRLAVASSLMSGKSQRETSRETTVSIATVTRVNKWLQSGKNGYKTVLERLAEQQHHHKA